MSHSTWYTFRAEDPEADEAMAQVMTEQETFQMQPNHLRRTAKCSLAVDSTASAVDATVLNAPDDVELQNYLPCSSDGIVWHKRLVCRLDAARSGHAFTCEVVEA